MGALANFKTIPEMFKYMTLEYGKGKDRAVLKVKRGGKYVDITYDEIFEQTELFALGLATLGVKKDDKVAMISENRPEWAYTDLAILGLGAIDVPLYPISTADTVRFILDNSESVGVVVSNKFHLNKVMKVRDNLSKLKFIVVMNDVDLSEYGENVYTFKQVQDLGRKFKEEEPEYFIHALDRANENDLCTLIYTSGTTGEPKGVMLTHKNILSNVHAVHQVLHVDDKDTFLSFLPLCHVFERMAGYYFPFSAGTTIAYAEGIEKIASNLLEIKPTVMTAVPRLFERMYSKIIRKMEKEPPKKRKIFDWSINVSKEYHRLKREGRPVPLTLKLKYNTAKKLVLDKLYAITGGNLRFFVSGGAALPRELGEFFEAAGMLIIEGYGLTETSPVLTCNRENDYKFGSPGKVIPGVELKIASDGEILAAGPNIMQGYYKNKKETEAVMKDGWFHTGDIGVFDAEGFLIITDRKKNLFKTTGGKYVAPTPIENMFLASKYIEQFVLIGDRRMYITALIVPDFEALKEYADAHRIPYKDPKELVKLKQIEDMLNKELAQFQKNLANFERVRKFTLLDKPFSVEDGELTPKLSVRRKVIEERYRDLIDEMYK
jgi:long-chain acyl-CoA synthetase